MEIRQGKIEKILTTLLKIALSSKISYEVDWKLLSDSEWKECYELAAMHGVMALAFDGVQQLPIECQPNRPVRLSWAVAVKNYEGRYERYCHVVHELSSFYAERGIGLVQLKGVGLSSYYPVPSHREGGDIDIYTYSLNHSVMSNAEANQLANRLIEDMGITVEYENDKHSTFYYKGIPIENHKTFLDLDENNLARSIDCLLKKLLMPSKISLCDNQYEVYVPSPEFNVLFLSCHAAMHYYAGMRLHHIFDWACLLKTYGLPLSDQINDRKLLRFIYSLTEICNKLLGTEVTFRGNSSLANEIYQQVMHLNNEVQVPKSKIAVFFYKIARLIYLYRMRSKVYDRSLRKTILTSYMGVKKNPKRLFS